jgi:type I restriction enzyme S subunit
MVIRSGILKHTLPIAINTVPVTVNQDMKAFILGINLLPEFLVYAFHACAPYLLGMVRGITADNIDFSIIKDMLLPVPPLEVQSLFAKFVNQSTTEKNDLEIVLSELEVKRKVVFEKYL